MPVHRASAGQGSPDPLLPKDPPPKTHRLPSQWLLPDHSLLPGLGAPGPRSAGPAGALVPTPRQSRAELPAACDPGGHTVHSRRHSPGSLKCQGQAAQQGSPGPLDTRGARGQVSSAAARRRGCGDTRVCQGTGGSGWSGTCGDRGGVELRGVGVPQQQQGAWGTLRSSPPPPGRPRPPGLRPLTWKGQPPQRRAP